MRTIGCVMLAGALALSLVACEKDSGMPSKQSGSVRRDEGSLLAYLPAGNVGLFGGNYLRLQDFFQKSAFAKLMGNMESISPGMTAWTECFVHSGNRSLQMMGALAYSDDGITMRYVMKGFGVEQVKDCAQKAGFPVEVDGDGKFVSISMPTALGPVSTGYLVLADGALMTRQAMAMPPVAAMPSTTTRADLEADVALLAKGTAADDKRLIAELAKIDRDRAMWFVGDAAGTPMEDKLGTLRGWVDLDDGITMDVAFQLKDRDMVDEISKGIPEMKKQAGALGKDIGDVVRGIKFERKGDNLRFVVSISNRQLDAIVEQMGPLMGAGLGGGGGGF